VEGTHLLATLTTDTEADLITMAQNGDRNAFGELVRRHYPKTVQIVHRFCGDPSLAEDATQEAFLRAWVNLPTFRVGSSLQNWIYRIAINAAVDALRRRPDESFNDEKVPFEADRTPGPEIILIAKERTAAVQQAIKTLPHAARSVLVLREYGELSYREIAEILDIPFGTVMSRLNYARTRLRQLLEGYLVPSESKNE
jgi:RNA polymerase sigma-70 factor (ECF subfamily)